jgi:hypothetical protein
VGTPAKVRSRESADRLIRLVPVPSETNADQVLRRRRTRAGRFQLTPDQVGVTVHQIIGELLVSDIDLQDPRAIHGYVLKRVRSFSISHTQSRRQRVSTSVASYFARFRRDDDWQFLGAEVNVDDVRLDLLWIHRDGRIQADEVKTGVGAVFAKERSLRIQIESQVRAGRTVFGTTFEGVRAVLLSRPGESFLATLSTHGGI